jgi:hypothetical protein
MYPIDGVQFQSTAVKSIKTVRALDPEKKLAIAWDRFVRLRVTADIVRARLPEPARCRILDLNGWDGALVLFLPEYNIDIFMDATAYGAGVKLPVLSHGYDLVASVGDIEHIGQDARASFIAEICRVAKSHCLVGFPNPESIKAQELVYELTGDADIKEHIDCGLPEPDWVKSELEQFSFACEVVPCGSVAVWVLQSLLENLAPTEAALTNAYLIEEHEAELFDKALYLIVCGSRKGDLQL